MSLSNWRERRFAVETTVFFSLVHNFWNQIENTVIFILKGQGRVIVNKHFVRDSLRVWGILFTNLQCALSNNMADYVISMILSRGLTRDPAPLTKSAFSCLYLIHYLLDLAATCKYWLFQHSFSESVANNLNVLKTDVLLRHICAFYLIWCSSIS